MKIIEQEASLFFFKSSISKIKKQAILDWFNSLTYEKQNFVYALMSDAVNEALFFEQGD